MTNEARVLRALRIEHSLSMKKAAGLMEISDSTVSHIETGRMDVPKGERLERFLRAYGGIKAKSFYERVRNFQDAPTPQEELLELVQRVNPEQAKTLLSIAKGILG